MFDPTVKSKYPPREDITRVPGLDHEAVAMFDDLNPFDSVSQATPAGQRAAQLLVADAARSAGG
jgi:hypothetical protein